MNDLNCLQLALFSNSRTFSRVSRPVWTILSAISAHGIRPEKEADVYPYVTLAIYFNASCRLFCSLRKGLLSLSCFILFLTMTRVSRISDNILARRARRIDC